MIESFVTDTTGATVDHSDITAGVAWLHDTQISNIHGQWTRYTTDGVAARTYTYDSLGRLTTAAPVRPGGDPCEKRGYTFDTNGNRTSLMTTANTATSGINCTTTTTNYGYDNADRLLPTGTATGTSYDAWGRITTVPATLAGTYGNGRAIA